MKLSKNITAFLIAGIVIIGILLRGNQYATWPRLGATFDEFAWVWQGMSILKEGMPRSWSYHPQYKDREIIQINGANFILVRPYLEHPPFFGLVAGTFAMLTGQSEFTDIQLPKIRMFSLILGTVSVFFVFWLAALMYGNFTGLLAALIYAITPTVAVGSRLMQNENFFIPMWLGMLICLWYYLKTNNRNLRTVVGVLGGLLILAKIPWIAGAISAAGILWYVKRVSDAWKVLLISLAIGSIYIFYGFYFDKTVFTGLMGLQLNRYDITFAGVYSLWLKPYLADRLFLDGWIYGGWLALLVLISSVKKHWFLLFAVFSYAVLYAIGIPDEPGHGWYRYPFYPFLSIATAVVVRECIWPNPFYRFTFLLLVGLPLLSVTWGVSYGFSYFIYRGYILWSLISFLPYVARHKLSSRLTDVSFIAQCIFIFSLTVWAILGYNEQ